MSSDVASNVLPTDDSPSAPFCRVISASPESVVENICIEQATLVSLRQQYLNSGDTEFLPLIAEGLHHLEEKRKRWLESVRNEKQRRAKELGPLLVLQTEQKVNSPAPLYTPPSPLVDIGANMQASETGGVWDEDEHTGSGPVERREDEHSMMFQLEEDVNGDTEEERSSTSDLHSSSTAVPHQQRLSQTVDLATVDDQPVSSLDSDAPMMPAAESINSDSSGVQHEHVAGRGLGVTCSCFVLAGFSMTGDLLKSQSSSTHEVKGDSKGDVYFYQVRNSQHVSH
jgi:hypothetical protein